MKKHIRWVGSDYYDLRPGWPVIEAAWRYDSASHSLEIGLTQTQPGERYRLPLQVSPDEKTDKIEMTAKRQRFTVPAATAPAGLTLDPNNWVLMEAHVAKR